MTNDANAPIIEEFRANNGRVGGWFEGARLLLLTTVGARSGRPHTVPLSYLPDGGERVFVLAGAAGSPRHPAWYHNVLANPTVTVEDGVFTYEATATVLVGEERDRAFDRAMEHHPDWRRIVARTTRVVPVVALTEIPGPPRINATSPGGALKLIHDAFRRELGLIRAEVATAGPTLTAQLKVNCLTLCRGLAGHHSREDAAMFPGLERERPDLAPVLAELRAQHEEIAALLASLNGVLADASLDRQTLGTRVDRLVADLERHLDHEEAALVPVLDGTATPPG